MRYAFLIILLIAPTSYGQVRPRTLWSVDEPDLRTSNTMVGNMNRDTRGQTRADGQFNAQANAKHGAHSYGFDGDGDYYTSGITLPDLGKANQSFTVALWFKVTAPAPPYAVGVISKSASGTSKQFEYRVFDSTSNFSDWIAANGVTNPIWRWTQSPYTDNTWRLFVGVRDVGNSQWRVYIDGRLVTATISTEAGFSSDFSNGAATVQLGTCIGGDLKLSGEVSQIQIWYRALTQQEMLILHQKGRFH